MVDATRKMLGAASKEEEIYSHEVEQSLQLYAEG